jgi:hypothetical protein
MLTYTVSPYNETDKQCAFKATSFSPTNQLKQAMVLLSFYKHTRHTVSAVCLMKNSKGAHTNKYDLTTVRLALLITNSFAGDSQGGKCKGCGPDAECDKTCIELTLKLEACCSKTSPSQPTSKP